MAKIHINEIKQILIILVSITFWSKIVLREVRIYEEYQNPFCVIIAQNVKSPVFPILLVLWYLLV